VFPHNYDFASPTPYFIDRKTGTLCAVAYLLESTGRRDIVNRVAEADNNVWVAKLSGDSAFASWLDTQGITLDEAARIQVPYVGGPSESQTQTSQNTSRALTAGGALVTATALATTTYNVWGNRNGHSRLGNYTGLTSNLVLGSLGALMASQAQSSERAAKTVGVTSALVGTVGVALATRAILHRPRYLAAEREKENVRRANIDASISPIIPLDRNSGAGLSMAIRF
jgi:hypothetical protein